MNQGPDEDVLAYLARAETLRLGLSRYNVTWTEREANRHIARHLNESTDVLNDHEIPVGQTNVPLSMLEREFGPKRVERSMKVWNFLLRSVADPTILRLMIESRSPQAAW